MDKTTRIGIFKFLFFTLIFPGLMFLVFVRFYGLTLDVYISNAYGYIWGLLASIAVVDISKKKTIKRLSIWLLLLFFIPLLLLFIFVTPCTPVETQPKFVSEVGFGVVFGTSISAGSITLNNLMKKKV